MDSSSTQAVQGSVSSADAQSGPMIYQDTHSQYGSQEAVLGWINDPNRPVTVTFAQLSVPSQQPATGTDVQGQASQTHSNSITFSSGSVYYSTSGNPSSDINFAFMGAQFPVSPLPHQA